MTIETSKQIEIRVPQLSESVSEATLLSWHKQAGEAVQEGENLIDVETDKVVLELPAIKSGVLVKILKQNGEKVTSNEVIALLDTAAQPGASPAAQVAVVARTQAAVMPAAQKIAEENRVDTATIQGTGRDGRVLKEDVLNVLQATKPAPSPLAGEGGGEGVAIASAGSRIEQRVPMTRIRQRIAERLLQSQQNAAILTTFNEVNMQPVIELRNKYKDAFEKKHGVKLGFSSFFVKAAVAALQKFPLLNASIDGADIIYHGYYDIGVAIGSERGLVVPVIRDADQLSLAGIERQIADFGARAKNGKLALEELSGGTFSITNGGVFGSMLSTPIINPPQSAILGIHATKDRPVAENGQVVIRPMNYLALSYDHRIVDGRDAVLFLVAIKEALEYPGRGFLDL
ncbi:MAG: 2-oxoglutarate dehydrogenase complex dihydrolipoyllysine-residue succinyltransferase [Nitrosomonadales bacterium]|nr:2-oxoglutarate dehydrogenase complex dihydrolipoyllysine-residue succinyltransferase [Nitrosomonadales bacterium]